MSFCKAGIYVFKRYINKYGMPDIIHAHNVINAGMLSYYLKKKYSIPFVLTEHDSRYGRGVIARSHYDNIKKVFRFSDFNAVVSPCFGELLERSFGLAPGALNWIPNVLDKKFETTKIMLKNKETINPFIFLHIAHLIEVKRQSDLLNAFAMMFKEDTNIQLRIAGIGHLKNDLENLTQKLGINEQIIFLGEISRDEVVVEMDKCNVFVLSSEYETFGVVLIEALSRGKPVIATACGGPDCIVNEFNGILVKPKDISALADAMLKIKNNLKQYDPRKIRKDCLRRFGQDTFVKKMNGIYTKLFEN